jgi:prevent-host-death family protein
MRIAPVAEIKAQLSAFIKASEESPVVVTKNGKPVAVLIGTSDEDEIERLILAHSKKLRAFLDVVHGSRIHHVTAIPFPVKRQEKVSSVLCRLYSFFCSRWKMMKCILGRSSFHTLPLTCV